MQYWDIFPKKIEDKTRYKGIDIQLTIMTDTSEEPNMNFASYATDLIKKKYEKKVKRDIWEDSKWKNIAELENDDVGGVGEEIINEFCRLASINADIDGTKTKQLGGGEGDGKINNKSVEIKTARLGSSNSSFQHELGEVPWKADYMVFLDIAPHNMAITIFPNFSEEFYKKSGGDSSIKCKPYFPTKSITWRKLKGAFKFDTTLDINSTNKYTFTIDENTNDYTKFYDFVNSIITEDIDEEGSKTE